MDDDDLDGEDDSSSQPLTTHFELNDTLFAEAEIEDTDEVYLWLGVRLILLSSSRSSDLSPTNRPTSCCHTRSQQPSRS